MYQVYLILDAVAELLIVDQLPWCPAEKKKVLKLLFSYSSYSFMFSTTEEKAANLL